MTRLKLWILVLALGAIPPLTHSQELKGKVMFSVEVLEWALERNADGSSGPKKRTGVFYY